MYNNSKITDLTKPGNKATFSHTKGCILVETTNSTEKRRQNLSNHANYHDSSHMLPFRQKKSFKKFKKTNNKMYE